MTGRTVFRPAGLRILRHGIPLEETLSVWIRPAYNEAGTDEVSVPFSSGFLREKPGIAGVCCMQHGGRTMKIYNAAFLLSEGEGSLMNKL